MYSVAKQKTINFVNVGAIASFLYDKIRTRLKTQVSPP